jgi:hypothetical protein
MKFKNKKGFLIRDFVVAGIIFGIIMLMFSLAVVSIADNYGNTEIVNEKFSENYNKLQANLDALDTSFKEVKGGSGLNLIGTFDIAFNSVFTVIAMVWNGLTMYTDMIGSLISDFTFLNANIVSKFLQGIIAIITVYLIFVWISSVTRGKL